MNQRYTGAAYIIVCYIFNVWKPEHKINKQNKETVKKNSSLSLKVI
jgi:hypothetical protein